MAHIGGELVLFGGLYVYMNKKIKNVENQCQEITSEKEELHEKIDHLENQIKYLSEYINKFVDAMHQSNQTSHEHNEKKSKHHKKVRKRTHSKKVRDTLNDQEQDRVTTQNTATPLPFMIHLQSSEILKPEKVGTFNQPNESKISIVSDTDDTDDGGHSSDTDEKTYDDDELDKDISKELEELNCKDGQCQLK